MNLPTRALTIKQTMKKIVFFLFFFSIYTSAQIGINTTDPKGALDVTSIDDLGLVIPRVNSLEDVTDNNGNEALNGSLVYDISRQKTCFKINGKWICLGEDSSTGNPTFESELLFTCSAFDYLKPTVTQSGDFFGFKVDSNAEGNIIAISNPSEDSNATGINGDATNNASENSGAVYIFVKNADVWTQEAFIKASNTDSGDFFGWSISLNDEGNKLAVGSFREDSGDATINGNQNDNSVNNAGAVYIFNRSGGVWTQEAYIKSNFINLSNSGEGENFGLSLDFNGDGTILAVGAVNDDGGGNGINSNPAQTPAVASGAVHLYSYNGTNWQHDDYIKAAVADDGDFFGSTVKLSNTGERLVVSANRERSNSTTINAGETNNSLFLAGAVYSFVKNSGVWSQEAFIKPSTIDAQDRFGLDIAINNDASVLAVGVPFEDSNATGINGDATDNSSSQSGAVFIFTRIGTTWSQQAYIKMPFATTGWLGWDVDLDSTGNMLIVGAQLESSDASCFNGDPNNTNNSSSGAAFTFTFDGSNWNQTTYIKSPNPDLGDAFGEAVSISKNANAFIIAARREDSSDGTQNNDSPDAGAVYVVN